MNISPVNSYNQSFKAVIKMDPNKTKEIFDKAGKPILGVASVYAGLFSAGAESHAFDPNLEISKSFEAAIGNGAMMRSANSTANMLFAAEEEGMPVQSTVAPPLSAGTGSALIAKSFPKNNQKTERKIPS